MNDLIIISKDELGNLLKQSVKEALLESQFNSSRETEQEILDLHQAATLLKLKEQTIYGYTSQKQIPFIKRGKKLYFEKSRLEEWLKEGSRESINDIRKRLEEQ